MSSSGQVIGIDLGTTFSSVAYLDSSGRVRTIPSSEGELTTPSVILFDPDGTVLVGRQAHQARVVYPNRTATCIKRDMGEPFYSQLIAGKRLSPTHLSAIILKKLKQDAESKIGNILGAVITVPAYFDESRRQATVDAGIVAGLNVLDIINEPTSAAMAYGFKNFLEKGGAAQEFGKHRSQAERPETTIVYDLGGGTFDVSLIRIEGDDFHVIATDGDIRLGGNDWDGRIVDYASKLFIQQHGTDPREDAHSHQYLLLAAEEAKKHLSRRASTVFTLNHGGHRLVIPLTREKFEELTCDLLYRTESRTRHVLEQSGVEWSDLDRILLVGGSTRMPQVTQMLEEISKIKPDGSLSVDEIVAHGAAIHAAVLHVTGKCKIPESLPQNTPAADAPKISIKNDDIENLLVQEGDFPDGGKSPKKDTHDEPQKSNEDESSDAPKPAEGADYDEKIIDILLTMKATNVNAHSLGIITQTETPGMEKVSFLIKRNTSLPASVVKTFGTAKPNQESVIVRIVEGEAPDPVACVEIGKCIVAPLPRNLPKKSPVTITFAYDNSGRIKLEAREEISGTSAKIVIHRTNTLDGEGVEKARKSIAGMKVN